LKPPVAHNGDGTHWAVGCSVTLQCTTRRRAWARISNTHSPLHVTVSIVKKSKATRSYMWVFSEGCAQRKKMSRISKGSGFREGQWCGSCGRLPGVPPDFEQVRARPYQEERVVRRMNAFVQPQQHLSQSDEKRHDTLS